MYNMINTFLRDIDTEHDKLRTMPLGAAKFYANKKLYNLALFMQECCLSNYMTNSIPDENKARLIRFSDSYVKTIKEYMETIAKAENVNIIYELMEEFTDTISTAIYGWFLANRYNLPNVYDYSMLYESVLINSDHQYLEEDNESAQHALDELLAMVARDIHTNRMQLNMFSSDIIANNINNRGIYVHSLVQYLAKIKPIFEAQHHATLFKHYAYFASNYSYEYAANQPKECFDHTITGDSTAVRISNCFDMGIMSTLMAGDLKSSFESTFFKINSRTARHGLEVILLPKIFLSDVIVKFLCNYLEGIQIYTASNFSDTGIVALTGFKREKATTDLEYVYATMLKVLVAKASDEHVPNRIVLSAPDKITFRSARPDKNDILKSIEANKDYLSRNGRQVTKAIDIDNNEKPVHPMLPFSAGQLGLVLVSGKIDGIVNEGNGFAHVIKGYVYKTNQRATTVNEDGDTIESIVTGNATTVTMLTADGIFKELR